MYNSIFESFSLKCPKCFKGKIFSSIPKIKMNSRCNSCKLDFSTFDVGDGPAYVAGFIICFLIPILAITVEVYFKPNLVTHAFLWTSLIFIFTYLILIYSRSSFMHLEYKIRKLENKK